MILASDGSINRRSRRPGAHIPFLCSFYIQSHRAHTPPLWPTPPLLSNYVDFDPFKGYVGSRLDAWSSPTSPVPRTEHWRRPWGPPAGKFLGFMLTNRGIEANPDKCKAVLNMQAPRTKKEVDDFPFLVDLRNILIHLGSHQY